MPEVPALSGVVDAIFAADGPLANDPYGGWELTVLGGNDPKEDSQRIADIAMVVNDQDMSIFVHSCLSFHGHYLRSQRLRSAGNVTRDRNARWASL